MNNTKYVTPHIHEGDKNNLEMKIIKEGKGKHCGEKWDPKHRCAKGKVPKNPYKCEATNDYDSDESDIEEIEYSPQVSPEQDDESIPQVSLLAMTGILQPQTLKLKVHIKKNNVIVLIEPVAPTIFWTQPWRKDSKFSHSPCPT